MVRLIMPNILLALTYAWLHCCDGFKSLLIMTPKSFSKQEVYLAKPMWIATWLGYYWKPIGTH